MIKLPHALADWKSDRFAQSLRHDLMQLKSGILPLDKGIDSGGYVDDQNMEISVLKVSEDNRKIHATVGVFFTEIVICCGCGDDPMERNAYCEMVVRIDKGSAEAAFEIVST
jgi:hypothetical protein